MAVDVARDFYKGGLNCADSTLRCLIDGESDDSRWPLTARTAGGRLVHLVGSPDAVGTYRDVKITDSNTWALFGQLI